MRRKIEGYMKDVRNNVVQRTETRLYKNLPAPYHDALSRAIDHVRRASAA